MTTMIWGYLLRFGTIQNVFCCCFFVTYAIIQSSTSSEMCALHLTHPCAHTHFEQWAADVAVPGEQLGFCPLLKSLTSVMDNSCRSRDSNPQPRVTSLTLYPLGHGCPLLLSSHQEIWKAIFTLTSERFGQRSQELSLYIQSSMLSWIVPNFVSHFWASAIFYFYQKCYNLRIHWQIIMKPVMCF